MRLFIGVVLLALLVLESHAYVSKFGSSVSKRNPTLTPLCDASLVVSASYDLAAGSAVLGTLCGVAENFKGKLGKVFGAGAIVFTLFGGFVAFQTNTLSFKFDEDSFSLVKSGGEDIGENVVVGGENDWKYSSFVNWGYLPSEKFPILVYFKETQTSAADRVEAPEFLIPDTLDGQAHFFPAIANTAELTAKFEKNNCKKIVQK